jgi:hypothetical protein
LILLARWHFLFAHLSLVLIRIVIHHGGNRNPPVSPAYVIWGRLRFLRLSDRFTGPPSPTANVYRELHLNDFQSVGIFHWRHFQLADNCDRSSFPLHWESSILVVSLWTPLLLIFFILTVLTFVWTIVLSESPIKNWFDIWAV